jgi:flagellar hook-associated protein 3 FlgL
MSFVTSGDAARFATFGQDIARLKADLQRASQELGSGRKADIGLGYGDFTGLSEMQRGLRLNESFRVVCRTRPRAQARQSSLDRLAIELENAGPELLAVVSNGRSSELALTSGRRARSAGRSDVRAEPAPRGSPFLQETPLINPALADASTILRRYVRLRPARPTSRLRSRTSMRGSRTLGPWLRNRRLSWRCGDWGALYLGEGELTQPGISATEPGMRNALSGLAMAALAAEGSLPATAEAQASMAEAAAERMLNGDAAVVEIRARLGVAEGRIEEARVRAEATRTGLQLEEARLTSADPYDSATELEKARLQLENLYVLTSRLSNLTLSAYLR